jgi:hypothetical protein
MIGGSRSPERVPIGSPSQKASKPLEVCMDLPALIVYAELAQVKSDDVCLVPLNLTRLPITMGHISMRGTTKFLTPQIRRLIELVWDGIEEWAFRERLDEKPYRIGDMWNLLAEWDACAALNPLMFFAL